MKYTWTQIYCLLIFCQTRHCSIFLQEEYALCLFICSYRHSCILQSRKQLVVNRDKPILALICARVFHLGHILNSSTLNKRIIRDWNLFTTQASTLAAIFIPYIHCPGITIRTIHLHMYTTAAYNCIIPSGNNR